MNYIYLESGDYHNSGFKLGDEEKNQLLNKLFYVYQHAEIKSFL